MEKEEESVGPAFPGISGETDFKPRTLGLRSRNIKWVFCAYRVERSCNPQLHPAGEY